MNTEKKFPAEFVSRINTLLGKEAGSFFSALSQPPFLSVRINPFKPTGKFNHCKAVPWCSEGKYLESRPSFIFDPLFHAGTYYVQEPSSMFLSEILRQVSLQPGSRLLDLCAAPGGKSTLLLSKISPESLLVSNEVIKSRVPVLHENLMKWGVPNVMVTSADPQDFSALKNYFDVIVIDAPCSGEGLFRKDKEAVTEWSENNVRLCSARQKRIVSAVFDSLKEGGILIYSTCTFSPEEDEENVKYIAGQGSFETIRIDLQEQWGVTETAVSLENSNYYSYRFYPHKAGGEGFFVSVLRKNSLTDNHSRKFHRTGGDRHISKVSKEEARIIAPWLKDPGLLEFIHWRGQVYALLKEHLDDSFFLSGKINIYSLGICLGKIVNGNLIPSHELALSDIISSDIQSVDVNEETALKFLRRTNITVDVGLKGWTLVRFKGYNLGWIKMLGNRINNYFPKELRILKT